MAYQALLEEVYTVPKPGLVDPYSCGAHTDMDVQTFERSAEALYPWFVRMAYQGYQLTCTSEDLFREIRKTGMLAEEAMYRAKVTVRKISYNTGLQGFAGKRLPDTHLFFILRFRYWRMDFCGEWSGTGSNYRSFLH